LQNLILAPLALDRAIDSRHLPARRLPRGGGLLIHRPVRVGGVPPTLPQALASGRRLGPAVQEQTRDSPAACGAEELPAIAVVAEAGINDHTPAFRQQRLGAA